MQWCLPEECRTIVAQHERLGMYRIWHCTFVYVRKQNYFVKAAGWGGGNNNTCRVEDEKEGE